ncbi:efflux RND transporter permease subunit [Parapedobacter sp. 10938]|uniref:efflux RND transporter permease subunit n=1 Tax=Parapedobacter flavus TaxID=3110225 RepID=UPI002DB910ED|nr:efflux RND transporter permease subunit [Parapedobacter sp. 10938]MEC3881798.1 efflux RND transporter permease subunit [Parapedobacter sp. 10938]
MIRFLVHRPISVLVSFFALLLLGITAYVYLPTSLLPDSDIPEIAVELSGEYMSSEEVEEQLTTPIRNALLQLHGLDRIESRSMEGEGLVLVRFEAGSDISKRFIEVNEKVDMSMNGLPREAKRPLVTKMRVDDIPVFQLNVSVSDSLSSPAKHVAASELVRGTIVRRLEQLPEVAMVDATGYMQPQVRIEPKPGYLESLGLDGEILLQAFRENDINLGNIRVTDGHYQYFLKFTNDVESVESLKSTLININHRLLRLGDIATVTLSHTDETGAFYNNGRRAINLAIIKQSSARMEDLRGDFYELLEHMQHDYPDLTFELAQDQSALLDNAIGNLRQDLWVGGVLAALLMLLFIRSLKPALLIIVTIPVSLVISQLGFYLLGISINIFSLGGLILGLSMIIDNSIVVIDNIKRYRDEGSGVADAATCATEEVARPMFTSALTNCVVYIPLIFLSGLAGAVFFDQAISATLGVVASLIVAILLLPSLYHWIYTRKSNFQASKKEFTIKSRVNVTGWYEKGLEAAFRNPAVLIILALVLLAAGVLLYTALERKRLPEVSRNDFEIMVDWNEPIDIEENLQRMKLLLNGLDSLVVTNNTWVGEQQYLLDHIDRQSMSQTTMYIAAETPKTGNDLREKILSRGRQLFPSAVMETKRAMNAFDAVFSDRQAPIRLLVAEKNTREMPEITKTLKLLDSLQKILPNSRISRAKLADKVTLRANTEQAARYGIGLNELNSNISAAFKPLLIDHFHSGQDLVPIMFYPVDSSSISKVLSNTFIRNQSGMEAPLSAFVTTEYTQSYQQITGGIQGRYYAVDIYSEQAESDLSSIHKLIIKEFPGLEVIYSGAYFDNRELITEMAAILLVSILLLYFILAAQFESLIQPLFILVELPIAISGALLFLYITGNSINIMALIGIVVMCGIIINDSILKIDAINLYRRQGVPLKEAIFKGGHKRLKPIIMITLTSIGSLAPTLFMHDMGSSVQQPLVLTLIGGMVVGLLVSLFIVPILYWAVYKGNFKLNEDAPLKSK